MEKKLKLATAISAAAVIVLIIAGAFIYEGFDSGYSNELEGTEEAILTTAPNVPPPITRNHPTKVIVHLFTKEKIGRLADGVQYTFWTFNGTVPGPMIRVRQGDLVEIHLSNDPKEIHNEGEYMSPTDKLHAHHEKLIGTIRALAERTKTDPADASLLLSYCNEYLVSHAEAEEVTLYAADDDASFVNEMIHEHKEIKHSLDVIDSFLSRGDSAGLTSEVDRFMSLLNKHFDAEENTLMPSISGRISEQELEALITEAHRIEGEKKKADVWALFEYDHKRIDLNISRLRQTNGDTITAKTYYSKTRAQLLKHIELEETVLFTTFGEYATGGSTGPVQVMIAEHREITSCISTPADRIDDEALRNNIESLVARLTLHNKKEELILYPLINRTIPRDVRDEVFKKCFEELSKV